jgi:hypothetical protein
VIKKKKNERKNAHTKRFYPRVDYAVAAAGPQSKRSKTKNIIILRGLRFSRPRTSSPDLIGHQKTFYYVIIVIGRRCETT